MESTPVNDTQEAPEAPEVAEVESSIIAVTAKKDGKEATVNFDFGTDLADAVEKFTAEVVFSRYRAAGKIDLQSIMRRFLDAGKNCQELLTIWKPGVTLERVVDPKATVKNAFAKMSPEEKTAFIAELKADM